MTGLFVYLFSIVDVANSFILFTESFTNYVYVR